MKNPHHMAIMLFDVWIFEVLYLKTFKLNFPFELLVIVYFLRFYLFLKGLREFFFFFFSIKNWQKYYFYMVVDAHAS
jgi:hypothetical protein